MKEDRVTDDEKNKKIKDDSRIGNKKGQDLVKDLWKSKERQRH